MSSTWIISKLQNRNTLLAASLAAIAFPYIYHRFCKSSSTTYKSVERTNEELHPLLADHTTFRSYTTSHTHYPRIRVFYHPHEHREKLPALKDLPLLVVIHGAGGVLPQFAPILGPLTHVAACFGIELPGHGLSAFEPQGYEAYTTEAFVKLWREAIEEICREHGHESVVLIGHSMGCSIAALLANSPLKLKSVQVKGLIGMCPKGNAFTHAQVTSICRFLSLPDFILNTIRWFDGLGYENSASVKRFVGTNASSTLKRQQYRWNKQFRTPVWRRVMQGMLPWRGADGKLYGGMPGRPVWEGVELPMLLVGGEADTITKPHEVADLVSWIQARRRKESNSAMTISPSTTNTKPGNASHPEPTQIDPNDTANTITNDLSSPALQHIILPRPASHSIPYHPSTYRILAGLIETFLSTHINQHLSFGVQLQLLTTTGKWDVKNLEKWRKVVPVSKPVLASPENPEGLFRALKTMRANDEQHSPTKFLQGWKERIYAVVDVSHDSPVYDTKELESGGVEYHKLPTVSKIPPTPSEVHDFVTLVDHILIERNKRKPSDKRAIAVHCHYGFNRTGFFIVSYLVLRAGVGLEDAIEEFARAKGPGIKHDHFLDELFVRYASLQIGGGKGGGKGSESGGLGATMAKERVKINRHGSAISEPDEHDLR